MSTRAGLTSRSLRGFLVLGSSTAGQAIVNIIFLGVLARLLTPSDFGIITAASVVTLLGDSLCRLGLGPALVQRPTIEPRHVVTASHTTLLLGLGLAGLLIVFRYQIEFAFRIDGLAQVLLPLSLVFPLRSACVVAEALAQRELKFGIIGSSQAASYIIGYGACGIGAAYLGAGLWSLVTAQLAQAIIRSAILIRVVKHPRVGRLDTEALKELLPFALDVTAVELLSYIANQADKFLAGRSLGAELLGLYGRAYQLTSAPALGFALIVDKVLFPALASVQNQPDRLKKAYVSAQTIVGIVTLPSSALLLILAPEVISIVLGDGWGLAIRPLQWLAAGTFLRTGYKLSGTLARSLGKTRSVVIYQAIYAAAVALFCSLFLKFGIDGIAFGVFLALLLEYILLANLSAKLIDVSYRQVLKTALPGLAIAIIVGGPAEALANYLRLQKYSDVFVILLSPLPGVTIAGFLLYFNRNNSMLNDYLEKFRRKKSA